MKTCYKIYVATTRDSLENSSIFRIIYICVVAILKNNLNVHCLMYKLKKFVVEISYDQLCSFTTPHSVTFENQFLRKDQSCASRTQGPQALHSQSHAGSDKNVRDFWKPMTFEQRHRNRSRLHVNLSLHSAQTSSPHPAPPDPPHYHFLPTSSFVRTSRSTTTFNTSSCRIQDCRHDQYVLGYTHPGRWRRVCAGSQGVGRSSWWPGDLNFLLNKKYIQKLKFDWFWQQKLFWSESGCGFLPQRILKKKSKRVEALESYITDATTNHTMGSSLTLQGP